MGCVNPSPTSQVVQFGLLPSFHDCKMSCFVKGYTFALISQVNAAMMCSCSRDISSFYRERNDYCNVTCTSDSDVFLCGSDYYSKMFSIYYSSGMFFKLSLFILTFIADYYRQIPHSEYQSHRVEVISVPFNSLLVFIYP